MTLPVESTADADPTAGFERRVAPLIGDLHRHAMRMTRHHADAEDLVQDTLANAFAGFDSFRPDSNIHAWLHRILVNTHISDCRKDSTAPSTTPGRRNHGPATGDRRRLFGDANAVGGRSSAEKHWRPRCYRRDARVAGAVPHHAVLRGRPWTAVQGNRRGDGNAYRNRGVAPAPRATPTSRLA